MEDKRLNQLCADIIGEDIDASNDAAKTLLNMSDDRGMRTELSKLVTAYQKAKESGDMNSAFEDIIQYCKNQYVAIVRQGIILGSSYQQRMYMQALVEAQRNQDRDDQQEKKEDQSSDIDQQKE